MNLAGIILWKGPANQQQPEALLESKLTFLEDVDFEEATNSFRDENLVNILETDTGTLIFTALGQLYDLENTQSDVIQFMVSDVSDTYYFCAVCRRAASAEIHYLGR